ncbi:ABC transporter permease [Pontibacter sp. G13]|uniref:ABC transporter permease n=1 Tax=Pontibacter sp. G13 TaxID=3074898 RepID=UPI00288B9424|nr:ABC transporter permease [Pontibacter sp. G13]WNJ18696.1 ABC transporter permease [Pontibacter sp. G13]
MFKNYLISAFRNFLRQKEHSFLNLMGLSVGLAAALLILQYVRHEQSFDQFHPELDQLYRVQYNSFRDGELQFQCASAFPGVGPSMKEDFPEVEEFSRVFLRYGGGVVKYEEVIMQEENLHHVDPAFFQMFGYKWLEGNPVEAMKSPNMAVIAHDQVEKYFGDESPIGKTITFNGEEQYVIQAIVESPEHSHMKFSFLLSIPSLYAWGDDMEQVLKTNFGWYDWHTYLKLRPETDTEALEAKFPEMIDRRTEQENRHLRTQLALQPVADIHLKSDLIQELRVNGDEMVVITLAIVAFFILLIAWINYVNLSTARAMERAREVGIRKTVGAMKGQLVRQFLVESVILNLLSAVFALALFEVSRAYFQTVAGIYFVENILQDGDFWLLFLGLVVFGGITSGLYPAFVLSGFQPVQTLKGKFAASMKGRGLRKGLVIGQFAASAILIAGTILIFRQVEFMRNQDLGMDIHQTLVLKGPDVTGADSLYSKQLDLFKQSALADPHVLSISSSSEIPGNLIYWTSGARSMQSEPSSSIILYQVGIDYEYIETLGHNILEGRSFDRSFSTDQQGVLLNERAVKLLGFESPEAAVNQYMSARGDTFQVLGVVQNFHQEGLHKAHDPIGFYLRPNASAYYSLRVDTKEMAETLAVLEAGYQQNFPGNPFHYFFLDDFFDRQYQGFVRFGRVISLFAMLGLFVACLGLIGLASYTASQRRKEISIRKVLGSSSSSIFMLLSGDYLKLVLIGNLIAIPLVWFAIDSWLDSFAYRLNIGLWAFVIALIGTIFLALLTVGYQSLMAARSNPADVLRSE